MQDQQAYLPKKTKFESTITIQKGKKISSCNKADDDLWDLV